MTTSSTLTSANSLFRKNLSIALAMGALAALSAQAHGGDLQEITISAPAVKVVGYSAATRAPIEEVTVTARVAFDPATLTASSGVALLKQSVAQAARKACDAAGPQIFDDGTCVRDAIRTARPQVDAVIARARSSAQG
jgi:UrcA family protein